MALVWRLQVGTKNTVSGNRYGLRGWFKCGKK